MRDQRKRTPNSGRARLLGGAAILLGVIWALPSFAQVPPRFYWKSLAGARAVPLLYMSMDGNANPFDPGRTAVPGASVEAVMAPVGFARTFTLQDRAAMVAVLVPMGQISGEMTVLGTPYGAAADGFGDPLLEFDINVVGKKAIKNIPDLLRYEPGFSLDLLVDLAFPIGEYDNEQPLNIGQNRWYGRLAAPIVWQFGAWVPNKRTTLEFLPSLWLFADNDDFVGSTLATEPMFQLEGHLTRNFASHLWGSLDGTWMVGGAATIEEVEGEELNNLGLGYTLGYQLNDNLQATFGYMSTVSDDDPGELRLGGFRLSAVYGWHPLVEGMKRLESGE